MRTTPRVKRIWQLQRIRLAWHLQHLFTINGNDYNDAFLEFEQLWFPSNLLLGGNELQEVAVVTNGYTGQYGRQAGAQIRLLHQIGHQRDFHGDAVFTNWTGRELHRETDPRQQKAFGLVLAHSKITNPLWAAASRGETNH